MCTVLFSTIVCERLVSVLTRGNTFVGSRQRYEEMTKGWQWHLCQNDFSSSCCLFCCVQHLTLLLFTFQHCQGRYNLTFRCSNDASKNDAGSTNEKPDIPNLMNRRRSTWVDMARKAIDVEHFGKSEIFSTMNKHALAQVRTRPLNNSVIRDDTSLLLEYF